MISLDEIIDASGDDDEKKGMGPLKLSSAQVGYMIKLTRSEVAKIEILLGANCNP